MKRPAPAPLVLLALLALVSPRSWGESEGDKAKPSAAGAPVTSAAGAPNAAGARSATSEALLFERATSAYPAASLVDLGKPGGDPQAARAAFEQLLREFPGGDLASRASFRLGLLQMDPANPRADIDAALATFERLIRRDPRSPDAPAALEAAALCRRLKGDAPAAAAIEVRLVAEHPGHPAAAQAQLRLALEAAKRGDRDAVRLLPRPREGVTSLDPLRLTATQDLLSRQKENDAAPRGELDTTFDSPFVKEPVSMAASMGGVLVLDASTGRVVSAAERPAPAADPDTEAPRRRGIATDARGRLWIWDEKGVTPPGGSRVEPLAPDRKGESVGLRRIVAVAPGLFGTVDVIDASGEQVLRYGPGFVLRGIVPLPARPLAAARSEDGTLDVLLESRPRKILEIRKGPVPAGWPEPGGASAPGTWETTLIPLEGADGSQGAPVGIARDDLGRIYVLDEDARSVTILDRDGRVAATYALATGSESELRAPSSIAVDARGRIYVADRKLGRVVRLR